MINAWFSRATAGTRLATQLHVRRLSVLLLSMACQRTDSVATTTMTSSSAPPMVSTAVLVPLATSAPIASSAPMLPPLQTTTTTASAKALAISRTTSMAKRDPMKACCDALRRDTRAQFAQAAMMCDGIVSALDQTGDAPQLEDLVKPILLDAPVPAACKGL